MTADGRMIMVCLSGGKDRYTMLAALGRDAPSHLMDFGLFNFKNLGMNVDEADEGCDEFFRKSF